MVPSVPVLPWEHLTMSREHTLVHAPPGHGALGQSWHHLGARTGQGKLHTITPPDCDCNLCSDQQKREYFTFSPQALEGVREKNPLCQLLCLELPAPGMGRQVGKGMMPRSAFAPMPALHQLSKKLCSRKEKEKKTNPDFFHLQLE